MKNKRTPFRWQPFSLKQKKVLNWWMDESPVKEKDGIIADGSVRAGKTIVMSFAFVLWAMEKHNFKNFIMAGKTIGSFRRNVIFLLKIILKLRGYKIKDKRTDNLLVIRKRTSGVINYFYIFGGKDESSQDLVQGLTAAGAFFDEVSLMPESFVNQAIARCSVEGAKLWFNCNPDGPYHWFKVNFLDKLIEKNLLHLHFTMNDNPSLSEAVKERYKRMFSGVFYQRYILGLWVVAEGIIYDMFNREKHVKPTIEREYNKYHISVDYGTYNVMTFGLWGFCWENDKWYKIKEYHYDGRKNNRQKTDEEYYKDLEEFAGDINIRSVIIDPSAASFITTVKKHKQFIVKKANNDVLDGIRNMSTALQQDLIYYNDCCTETFKELSTYAWDEKAVERGEDKPIKQNDHHMDGDRYFVRTILFKGKLEILK